MQVPSIVSSDDDKLTDFEEKSNTTIIDSTPAVQLVSEEEIKVSEIPKKGEKRTSVSIENGH